MIAQSKGFFNFAWYERTNMRRMYGNWLAGRASLPVTSLRLTHLYLHLLKVHSSSASIYMLVVKLWKQIYPFGCLHLTIYEINALLT